MIRKYKKNVENQPGLHFLDCYNGFPPWSGTCLITQPRAIHDHDDEDDHHEL